MTDDRELAKKCAFDARTLLNDMQGKGHINELKLLKAMQLLVNAGAGPRGAEVAIRFALTRVAQLVCDAQAHREGASVRLSVRRGALALLRLG